MDGGNRTEQHLMFINLIKKITIFNVLMRFLGLCLVSFASSSRRLFYFARGFWWCFLTHRVQKQSQDIYHHSLWTGIQTRPCLDGWELYVHLSINLKEIQGALSVLFTWNHFPLPNPLLWVSWVMKTRTHRDNIEFLFPALLTNPFIHSFTLIF